MMWDSGLNLDLDIEKICAEECYIHSRHPASSKYIILHDAWCILSPGRSTWPSRKGLDPKTQFGRQKQILSEADVVCSTCSGADHPVIQHMTFARV